MICGANPHNSSRFHDYSVNDCSGFYILIMTVYGDSLSQLQYQQPLDIKTI